MVGTLTMGGVFTALGEWAAPVTGGALVYGIVVYVAGLAVLSRWLRTNQPTLLATVGG